RSTSRELEAGPGVPRVQRVAPAHPRIARLRERALDRLEVRERLLEIAQVEVVLREVDGSIAQDLGVADVAGERRRALVVVPRTLRAADLRVAPPERVQHPAAPRPITDPLAELVRLFEERHGSADIPGAAARLDESPDPAAHH